jgi:hypothetical protein
MPSKLFGLFLLFLLTGTLPGTALAAACGSLGSCSTAGLRDWDGSLNTLKYCNGADWIDVQANMGDSSALTTGLTGHWALDDGTGNTTAADSSGSGYTGTLTSMDETIDWVGGQVGSGALDFDGSDDYVSMGDPGDGGLDMADGKDMTITGWFSRDTTSAGVVVGKTNALGYCSSSKLYGIGFDSGHGDQLVFNIVDNDGDSFCMDSATTFTSAGWHHFAVVYDADSTTGSAIYIDGVPDTGSKTGTAESIDPAGSAIPFGIGREDDGGRPFEGQIDDVRFYSRTLGPSEIFALYQQRLPDLGSCAGTAESTLEYDSGANNYKFCNGTDWLPVANNGSVGSCSGNPEQEYDAALSLWKWCDGSDWIDMSNLGTLADGLVGHWKLDESGNISTAADSAGSNDGTLTGFPADPSANWVAGKVGNALDFDGTDDWVNAGNDASLELGTGDQTIALWVKLAAAQPLDNSCLVCKGAENDTNEGYALVLSNTSDTLYYRISDGTTRNNNVINRKQKYFN